jgi:hypothetical protein
MFFIHCQRVAALARRLGDNQVARVDELLKQAREADTE